MVEKGIAFPVSNAEELFQQWAELEKDEALRKEIFERSIEFVQENVGASAKIMSYITNLEGWKKD